MTIIFLLLVSALTAMGFGGSGVVPSFSASFGARILKKNSLLILFTLAIVSGGLIAGHKVTLTLKQKFIPMEFFQPQDALIILLSTGIGLLIANILKIPQSTSHATVFAFIGVGLIKGHFFWKNFLKLIPYWISLPLVAYYLSIFICRQIYPASGKNLWIHQIIVHLEKHWKIFSILTGCYVAFAIGSNNLANIVGPLTAVIGLGTKTAMVIFGLLFGVGAIFFFRSLNTLGKELVPLGPVSAGIINGITATLVLLSSLLGIPQSLVQVQCLATIGIACVKEEYSGVIYNKAVQRIFLVWLITPMISLMISLILAKIFL